MAGESLQVTLPESFFETLNEISDTIKENSEKQEQTLQPDLYAQNILNAPSDVTKITPEFKSNDKDVYKKIGEAFSLGFVKPFFDYWKIIKKQEDYAKVKEEKPNIEILKSEKKETPQVEPSQKTVGWLNGLFKILGASILMLGIAYGKTPIGQIAESVAYLPNFLKGTFLNSTWQKRQIIALFKFVRNLMSPFTRITAALRNFTNFLNQAIKPLGQAGGKLASLLTKIKGITGLAGTIFTPVRAIIGWLGSFSRTLTGAATAITKLGTGSNASLIRMLMRAGSAILGPLKIALKKLPYIGSIIGFYQAYQRFQDGEYFQGTLEIAAAIAGLFPVGGTMIALGLNALQMLLDTSGFTGTSAILKSVTLGGSLISLLGRGARLLLKPLSGILKKLPFIGSVISFAEAYSNFTEGEYLKGTLNIASGIAGLFPGIGTAVALGIDVINMLLDSAGGTVTSLITKVISGGGNLLSYLFKAAAKILGPFSKILKKLPYIGSIISVAEAYTNFKDGEYIKGTLNIVSAIAGLFPGVGTAVAIGVDVINWLLGDKISSGLSSFSFKATVSDLYSLLFKGNIKTLSPLGNILKNLPLTGTIISLAQAYYNFKDGEYLKGLINLGESIPVIGPFITAGVNVIKWLMGSNNKAEIKNKKSADTGNWFNKVVDYVTNFITIIPNLIFGGIEKYFKSIDSLLSGWKPYDIIKNMFTEIKDKYLNGVKQWLSNLKKSLLDVNFSKLLDGVGNWFGNENNIKNSDNVKIDKRLEENNVKVVIPKQEIKNTNNNSGEAKKIMAKSEDHLYNIAKTMGALYELMDKKPMGYYDMRTSVSNTNVGNSSHRVVDPRLNYKLV